MLAIHAYHLADYHAGYTCYDCHTYCEQADTLVQAYNAVVRRPVALEPGCSPARPGRSPMQQRRPHATPRDPHACRCGAPSSAADPRLPVAAPLLHRAVHCQAERRQQLRARHGRHARAALLAAAHQRHRG
eukprot:scaffold69492_cov27-Phaeocystis_antarctica.AAC.1